MGSIAAGGRYDNLVAMFTSAAAGEAKKGMPCVGISIGMDRIFALVWPKWVEKGMRSKEIMVYVMAAGDGLLKERMELVQELREAGIKVGGLLTNILHPTVVADLFVYRRCRPTFWPRTNQNFPRSSLLANETKSPSRSFSVQTS